MRVTIRSRAKKSADRHDSANACGKHTRDPFSGLDFAAISLGIVLVVVCAIVVYRSPQLDRDKRRAWLMFLLFGSIFAFPILWYLLIFRADHPGVA